jgi:tRNA G18 (ribose-2'-O)-methylase SpoU
LKGNTLLIVGNEVDGVDKNILDLSDEIIEIPMLGKKESLNVSVATGIILYNIQKLP